MAVASIIVSPFLKGNRVQSDLLMSLSIDDTAEFKISDCVCAQVLCTCR